jgi:DNA-binding MarR family transcriptional regulator
LSDTNHQSDVCFCKFKDHTRPQPAENAINHYLNFVNLVRALADEQSIPDLDASTKQLLDEIALFQQREKAMTVTELMGLAHIASPATLHRKFTQLLNLGLVDAVFKDRNRRTKYVVLTANGQAYFKAIERAFEQAQKTPG